MKRIFPLALVCAVFFGSSSADDVSKPWGSVVFTVPDEAGDLSVKIEGVGELSKLALKKGNAVMEVPEEELAGINLPQLDSAQALFGEDWYGPVTDGEKAIPHIVIELKFAAKSEWGGFSSVRFLFYSGKFQERIELVQVSDNTWKEFRKTPGEERMETGTETRQPVSWGPPGS